MSKHTLLTICILFITGAASAQRYPATRHVPCDDCRQFPYKPAGCDNTPCLVQVLRVATRDKLINDLGLPATLAGKIIEIRDNSRTQTIQEYEAGLEPTDYQALLRGYDAYVEERTPQAAYATANVNYGSVIAFAPDQCTIPAEYRHLLNDVYADMKQDTTIRLIITGHTDKSETLGNSNTLAYRRAKAVKDYLVAKGIGGWRLTATGHSMANAAGAKPAPGTDGQNRNATFIKTR